MNIISVGLPNITYVPFSQMGRDLLKWFGKVLSNNFHRNPMQITITSSQSRRLLFPVELNLKAVRTFYFISVQKINSKCKVEKGRLFILNRSTENFTELVYLN